MNCNITRHTDNLEYVVVGSPTLERVTQDRRATTQRPIRLLRGLTQISWAGNVTFLQKTHFGPDEEFEQQCVTGHFENEIDYGASGRPSFEMSCSFSDQMLAQLDLLRNLMFSKAYKNITFLLPRKIDEKLAKHSLRLVRAMVLEH